MRWYTLFTSLRFFAAIQIIYFVKVTGSFSLGMSIFAVSSLSQALFEIPTGIFSDTVGRRPTTILAAFSGLVSVVLYAIGFSYWFLFLGAVIEGLGRSLGSGNNQALMFDSLKDINQQDSLYKYLGQIGTFQSIGFGLTALVGGFIAVYSFPAVMWLSAFTQLCGFVVTLLLVNSKTQSKTELNPYSHLKQAVICFKDSPQLRLLTLSRAFKGSIGEAAYQFAPSFIAGVWPIWTIGIYNATNNILAAVGYHISDKLIQRLKKLNLITGSFVFRRITDSLAFAFPSIYSPILLCLNSVFYGSGEVAEDSLLHEYYSDKQRATMGSLESLLTTLCFAIASVVIGGIADVLGAAHTLLLAQIVLLPVLVLYWKMFKHNEEVR